MRNWKKRSLGIFTSAAMLVSVVGGFVPMAAGAAEPDTVLIEEDYTAGGSIEDFGWGLMSGHSASNGSIALNSDGLTVTKTGSADLGLEKTLTHTEKDYAQSGSDEETRTRVWSEQIRGIFDVEFDGTFGAQGTNNGIWIDFKGSSTNRPGLGRLKMTSAGNAVPYKSGNSNNGTSGVNFTTHQQLRVRFDTTTRKFQIFSGDSTTALTANGGDSFDMTDWSVNPIIHYMNQIQINVDAKQNANAFYNLRGLKVTQIEPAGDELDEKMDTAVVGLTIASLTDDPSAVTAALSPLPSTIDGADGVSVTWASDKPDVISNDGQTVVQGEEDAEVVLTACITDTATAYCKYKDFKLTVPSVNDPSAPAAVLNRARGALEIEQLTTENPNNITQNLTLPKEWTDSEEYGGQKVTIAWKSDNTAVIDDGGVLRMPQPTENQTVTMTATLSLSGESVTKTFTFTVKQYVAGLLVEENFEGKTVTDNQVPGWSYASSTTATATNTITDGKLVMTKTSAPGSGGAESLVNQFYFRQTIEPYSDATRTESFRDTFNGKYRMEVVFRPHITSQFCALGFLGSASNSDGTPKKPFSLCVYSNKAEIYVSTGVYFPVYTGTLNDRENTLTYTIDTQSNDVVLQMNDGTPTTYTVANLTDAGYQLQGAYFAMKENQSAGDSITISSIKLYEVASYETGGDEIETAMKSLTAQKLVSDPAAVTDSVVLPEEVAGVSVRWTSSNYEYMTDSGKLVNRPFDADREVVMSARFEKGGTVRYKNYFLTIKKEDDPQVILQAAADKVDYSNLTSDNKDNLNTSLTLPSSGDYGTAISWKSSDAAYLSDSGQIVKLDEKERKEVVMTATFSLNGQTLEKQFVFHLALDSGSTEVIYQTDFSGSEIASNIKTINGGGTIVQENKTIKLVRTNGGDGTKIDIYPTFNGKEIKMRGEFEVETDVVQPEGCAKSELVLYGSNGNRLFTLYTGQANANANQRYTMVARNQDGTEYRPVTTLQTKAIQMKVRCQINTYTNSLNVWVDLNDGQGAKQVVTNKLLREDATDLSYIEITSVNNTDASPNITNNGTLTVNSAKVSASIYSVLYLLAEDMGYAAPIEVLDGQVTQNIAMVTNSWPGTEVVWSSSHPNILSAAGVIDRKALTEDTDVVLTLKLTLANQPNAFITQQFPLKVRCLDPNNLALGAKATSNAGSSTHPASKAIDGLMDTTWETARSETNPTLTVNLGGATVINQVDLWEAEVFGKYSVQQYKIEGSRDNKNWTALASGSTLGAGQKTHTFSPVIVQYVKYSVLEKEAGNSGLREFQISLRGDVATAEADLLLLIDKLGTLTGLTQSVTLPNVGEYGSAFTYSSSIPSYFSNSGVVTCPTTTERGILTITAQYGAEKVSKSIPISVMGTSGGNGGGGTPTGGGSGGSGGSGVAGGVVSYPPTDEVSISPNVSSTDFGDVNEMHWAYSYITTLKKRGIVSGDGNNTFRPEDSISREEFLKILLSALNIQTDTSYVAEFQDVAVSDWSYPYIAAGVAAGIVNGVSDTEFGAGQNITREDISVLCDRALRYVSKQLEENEEAEVFTDGGQISDYARASVTQMQKYGVLKGYEDGSFAPQRNASRAEAAKIIYMLAK